MTLQEGSWFMAFKLYADSNVVIVSETCKIPAAANKPPPAGQVGKMLFFK